MIVLGKENHTCDRVFIRAHLLNHRVRQWYTPLVEVADAVTRLEQYITCPSSIDSVDFHLIDGPADQLEKLPRVVAIIIYGALR